MLEQWVYHDRLKLWLLHEARRDRLDTFRPGGAALQGQQAAPQRRRRRARGDKPGVILPHGASV